MLDKLQAEMNEQQGEQGEGDPYESPEPVEYRGDFKPEMVQLLTKLQMDQSQMGDAEPMTQEELEQLLQDSAELELDAQEGDVDQSMAMFAQNIMKEAGVPPPSNDPGKGYGPILHDDDAGGELEALEPKTFVYDEWDFRANDYKPRWCIVKEKILDEGDPNFYNDSLRNYASLLAHIKRQFELIMPETWRKTYRLIDGEDIDLNSALEAWADLRMNVPPDEKIYWRRNRVERDVAVVFLLDMSASTAEAIDEGRHSVDDRDAPDDPVEYMVWLRRRREGAGAPPLQAHHRPGTRRLRSAHQRPGIHRRYLRYLRLLRLRARERRVLRHQGHRGAVQRQDQAAYRQGDATARYPYGLRHPPRHHQAGKPGRGHQDPLPHQRRPAPGSGLQPRGSGEGIRRPRHPPGPARG